jgi:anti-sigma B factor antagonist
MAKVLMIDESRSGRTCVVALTGRIDSTNAEELMGRLAGVVYLTSAAFRALLVASHEAERKDVGFALCNVAGQVRELFEMGGLLEAFTVHDSREEGLAKLA